MAGKRRNPEIIAGRVNADGTIAAGDGFTSVRNSIGNYTITFAPGFRIISYQATPAAGVPRFLYAAPYGASSVTMGLATAANALADDAFAFIAVGVQI
jgi:hypothetical protein